MGTLHQNRKGVRAEINSAKLKRGNSFSVYKDRLTIVKWKDKMNICHISTTHDDKIVPVREVVIDCNSWMGVVDLSDAYLTDCCSTRKRLKVVSKLLPSFD
jgi:hypothetical protein